MNICVKTDRNMFYSFLFAAFLCYVLFLIFSNVFVAVQQGHRFFKVFRFCILFFVLLYFLQFVILAVCVFLQLSGFPHSGGGRGAPRPPTTP